MSNSLDPDQARQNVGPDLGPICLQKLSPADNQFDVHAHLSNGAGDLNFCLHLYLLPLNLKLSAANIC